MAIVLEFVKWTDQVLATNPTTRQVCAEVGADRVNDRGYPSFAAEYRKPLAKEHARLHVTGSQIGGKADRIPAGRAGMKAGSVVRFHLGTDASITDREDRCRRS